MRTFYHYIFERHTSPRWRRCWRFAAQFRVLRAFVQLDVSLRASEIRKERSNRKLNWSRDPRSGGYVPPSDIKNGSTESGRSKLWGRLWRRVLTLLALICILVYILLKLVDLPEDILTNTTRSKPLVALGVQQTTPRGTVLRPPAVTVRDIGNTRNGMRVTLRVAVMVPEADRAGALAFYVPTTAKDIVAGIDSDYRSHDSVAVERGGFRRIIVPFRSSNAWQHVHLSFRVTPDLVVKPIRIAEWGFDIDVSFYPPLEEYGLVVGTENQSFKDVSRMGAQSPTRFVPFSRFGKGGVSSMYLQLMDISDEISPHHARTFGQLFPTPTSESPYDARWATNDSSFHHVIGTFGNTRLRSYVVSVDAVAAILVSAFLGGLVGHILGQRGPVHD
jgi:hypothetical protein